MYARKKYRDLKKELREELNKTEVEVEETFKKAEETTIMLENVHHSGVRPKEEAIVLAEHEKDIGRVERSVRQRIVNLRNKLKGK